MWWKWNVLHSVSPIPSSDLSICLGSALVILSSNRLPVFPFFFFFFLVCAGCAERCGGSSNWRSYYWGVSFRVGRITLTIPLSIAVHWHGKSIWPILFRLRNDSWLGYYFGSLTAMHIVQIFRNLLTKADWARRTCSRRNTSWKVSSLKLSSGHFMEMIPGFGRIPTRTTVRCTFARTIASQSLSAIAAYQMLLLGTPHSSKS